jgi:response regulator RpfG family c-di-GMP phosphodiesterase
MLAGQRIPTVLIAGTSEAVDIATRALGTQYNYRRAYSVEQALSLVDAVVDCIVCNVAFDESHMFDFLTAVRARKDMTAKPFLCFRIGPFSKTAHAAMDMAMETFGNAVFVDFYETSKQAGIPKAFDALKQAVERLIAAR